MRLVVHRFIAGTAFAVAAGIGGGLAAAAFSMAFDAAGEWFQRHAWAVFALPIVGVVELLIYRLGRLPIDMGMDSVAHCAREGRRLSPMLAPAIFLTSCLSAAAGVSVGKEAAAAQLGSAIASGLARLNKKLASLLDDGIVATCGMAAGVGALFGAPISGALFALETVRSRNGFFDATVASLVASVAACVTAHSVGMESFLPLPLTLPCGLAFGGGQGLLAWLSEVSSRDAMKALVVALACVLAGLLFARVLRGARAVYARAIPNPYVRVACGGVGIAAFIAITMSVESAGSGFALLDDACSGQVGLALLASKMITTFISLGAGFKGGSVMPMLALGAVMGSYVGSCLGLDSALATAIGMLSFFAASKKCPCTAAAMACELFAIPALVRL